MATSSPPPQSQVASVSPRLRWRIWRQWAMVNALAETAGLGATLLLGILLVARVEPALGPVRSAVLAVLLGACLEGGLVGTAQWSVLRGPLSVLSWQSWARATALGAGIAWALGMIPSTMMAMSQELGSGAAGSQPQEPGLLVYYSLAALLGLVAGALLALAQWQVLRRYVPHASLWIAANAAAWAVGMVLVFVGTSLIPGSGITPGVAFDILVFVALAGATVGAIHGLALIWLLRERDRHSLAIQLPQSGA